MEAGKFTENFSINEFLKSKTADEHGFMEQYSPPDEVIDNLENLCVKVLQPIRSLIGELTISSGYRCPRLNEAVKGRPKSQHVSGYAADIKFFENKKLNNQIIIDTVLVNKIVFDQMIWESGGRWVHISYREGKNRSQYFSA